MQSGPVRKMGNHHLGKRFLIGLIAGYHHDDHDDGGGDDWADDHNWLDSMSMIVRP